MYSCGRDKIYRLFELKCNTCILYVFEDYCICFSATAVICVAITVKASFQ